MNKHYNGFEFMKFDVYVGANQQVNCIFLNDIHNVRGC